MSDLASIHVGGQALDDLLAAWRSELHPRLPSGHGGGEFTSLDSGSGGRHTGPGSFDHIRSIHDLADELDLIHRKAGGGGSETAAALRNVAHHVGLRQIEPAKRHMGYAYEAAKRENLTGTPAVKARLDAIAGSLDKIPKGTYPEPGFGLRTKGRGAPWALQPAGQGGGYRPGRARHAAGPPDITENHPDCPADKPFGVPGADGKLTCHATRAQAQDLALSVTYPDADMSGAPGGVQVGAGWDVTGAGSTGPTSGNVHDPSPGRQDAEPGEDEAAEFEGPFGAAQHPGCPDTHPWATTDGDGNPVFCHVTQAGAQDMAATLNTGDGSGEQAEETAEEAGGAPGGTRAAKDHGGGDPAERMRIYWSHGEGAAKVAWGTAGDFDRCVAHVSKFMDNPQGYCAARHHDALGIWPATHAKLDREGKGDVKPKASVSIEDALAAWDPSKHPRAPAGGATGGQFAPGATSAAPTNAKPVGEGATGQQVRDLQERLNAYGAHLAVDGEFGPKTLAALRAFQAAHKDSSGRPLKVDGLVGPLTTSALRLRTPGEAKNTAKSKAKSTAGKTSTPKSTTSKTGGGTATSKTSTSKTSTSKTSSTSSSKLPTTKGSMTVTQEHKINTLLAQRAVTPAQAKQMRAGLPAQSAAGANTLIARLSKLPKVKGAHGKSSAVTYAAGDPALALPLEELAAPDVMAFQWAHGWKWLGGGGSGKGRKPRVHEPLIPEGGGAALPSARVTEKRLNRQAEAWRRAERSHPQAVPPLRHPLIPTGLKSDDGGKSTAAPWHDVTGSPTGPAGKLHGRWVEARKLGGGKVTGQYDHGRGQVTDAAGARHAVTAVRDLGKPPAGFRQAQQARESGWMDDRPSGTRRLTKALVASGGPDDGEVAARDLKPGQRFRHGWIPIDSAAAGDLDRGLSHDAAAQVKHHLDKAHEAAQAGRHGQAADHLSSALNSAIYGGRGAGSLRNVIRDAITEQKTKQRRKAGHDLPGAGGHVSDREAAGLAQMFGAPGKAQARPYRRTTSSPFGKHVSKREMRGFAQMFAAQAAAIAGHTAIPAGPPGMPALVTIPGVDLLAAGTWGLSTGRQTFTRADLEAAAEAARCPAVGAPVIKLGHLDPRFAPKAEHDGEPAIGRVLNIRLSDNGAKLTGDLAGMPGWLGAIAASAFPRRSVEGKFRFKCQVGHVHPFALTALALLGITPPGVGVLGQLPDIAALYGIDPAPSTTAAAAPADTWRTEPADQQGAVMPVTEEDVRRAYYARAGAPQTWWITELQMMPPQLIVAAEDTGKLYRIGYRIDGEAVEFDAPDEIASYSEVAAARGTGPVVVYASAEESRDVGDGEPDIGAAAGSDTPWGQFSASDYSPEQWHRACLIHDHGPGTPDTKDDCKLPVKEPDGTLNKNGVHAAAAALAGARGGVHASPAAKARAAQAIRGLYSKMGEDPPDSLSAAAPAVEGRLLALQAARDAITAAAADPDDDTKALIASLDATLDQAAQLAAGVDRESISAEAGQVLDLVTAAEALADQVMDKLGIYDPDDAGEDGSGDTAAAAGDGPDHGDFTGSHSHPHPAMGTQGGDDTHEHVHSHKDDASHDHAHDTHAAAQAASTETGGGPDMGFEFTSTQMAAIRRRLGKINGEPITAADIAAAMDTPRAPTVAASAGGPDVQDVQVPVIQEGTYLVDSEVLRNYQSRAVAGDRAVLAMHLGERDTILAAAVSEGKFGQARLEHFQKLWDKDPEGTRKLVASLAPGLVPMGGPLGSSGEFTGDPDMPGDFEAQRAYFDLYPEDRKGGVTPAAGVRGSRG